MFRSRILMELTGFIHNKKRVTQYIVTPSLVKKVIIEYQFFAPVGFENTAQAQKSDEKFSK